MQAAFTHTELLIMALGAGVLLDLAIGDPERLPHPVRWIGRAVVFIEGALRPAASTPRGLMAAGCVLAVAVAGGAWVLSYLILKAAYAVSPALFFAVSSYIVWTSLSIKSLKCEALSVAGAFSAGGLASARERLSRIVGRDTRELDREGVLRATVETVSENASDGVVAPLFFFALGGPAMMMAYKAINTLDSMVGYKNERYLDFGRASARLDDLANFVPARLTALLMVVASLALGYNWRASLVTALKEGRNHPSPNSGYPEAAAAGALGLKLGGPSFYGGVLSYKPFIGSGMRTATEEAVEESVRIMALAALFMASGTLLWLSLPIFLL